MKRREFLAAGVAGAAGIDAVAASIGKSEKAKRQYFELRQYHLLNRAKTGAVGDFLREVGIAAMNRIGIQPVAEFAGICVQHAEQLKKGSGKGVPNEPCRLTLDALKSLEKQLADAKPKP